MNKIIILFTICFLTLVSSASYAGGPVFLNKIKNAFSGSSSSKKKNSTVKPTPSHSKQKQAQTMNQADINRQSMKNAMAKRGRLMSETQNFMQRQQQENIDNYRKQLQQSGTGTLTSTTGRPTASKTTDGSVQKTTIIRRKSSEDSKKPKPIFKDFR